MQDCWPPTWLILILPINQTGYKLKWFTVASSSNSIHHLSAIRLSCFTLSLHPLFHGSTFRGGFGGSGVAQVHCRQRQRGGKWSYCDQFYLSPAAYGKNSLWPFSSAVLFSLTNRKAWRWKVKVPAVTFRPASGVTDRPVSKRHETPVSEKQPAKLSLLSCFIAVWFYYLLSCLFTLDHGQ